MGNILTQERHNRAGEIFDDLQYHYQKDANGNLLRNRLYHVNDDPTLASVMEDDIEDMDPFISAINQINTHNNYSYDAEGRLVKDKQEEIDTIIWTVSGKVKEIRRSLQSSKKNLTFEYDAFGNRIAKHVYDNQTLMLEKSTYYILDASGNQLSMYEHSVDDADVKYYLTERNIYGSSRLGTLKDPVNMFNAEPLQSYGILGNRNYELSNHLGNVLTVISDIKYPLSADHSTIDGYEVGITNVFDYSPFGAPLDGRTLENIFHQAELTTETITETVYALEEHFDTWFTWTAVADGVITYVSGEMQVSNPAFSQRPIGASKTFTVGEGLHAVHFEIIGNTCATINIWPPSTTPIPIQVVVKDNSNNVVASGFYTTAGNYSLAFTPTTPEATYTLEFYMPNASSLCFFRVDNVLVSYLEETVVETEGPGYVVRGGYRYGYNTQERVPEIQKDHYTAEFWEYDPRVVHRWNRDPKPNPSISPYAINQGNPILYSDPYGDTIRIDENASPEFRAQVEKELEILKSTKRGAKMYNNLHSAEEDFIIKESQDRSYFQANQITVRSFSTGEESEKFEKGGTIFYKLGGANIPVQKNERSLLSKSEKSGKFSLFHELGHAEDYLDENNRKRWSEFGKDEIGERGLSEAEWSSTFKENQIRTELNSPLRLYYFTNRSGKGSFPALLKIDKIGVKSIWSEQSEYYFIKFND